MAAELTKKAETLTERILFVTAPIGGEDATGQPEMLGSGVLFAIGEVRFLATAGHVLDHLNRTRLLAGVPPDLLSVAGLPTRLRSPGASTPKKDRIDIGVMRLQGKPWEMLGAEHFVAWSELDTSAPIMARHTYTLVGFPTSLNRRAVEGDRLKAAGYRLAGLECEQEVYESTATDPTIHVLVGFDKNAMLSADGPRNAPDLYGASGGGLWRFGRRLREATGPPKLSAIATEWHRRGRHKYILGTRIQPVVEALAAKYPDVGAFVAEHSTV